MTLDEFRQRPLKVTVRELCEHCNKLVDEVITVRNVFTFSANSMPTFSSTMRSCFACYCVEYDRANARARSTEEGNVS